MARVRTLALCKKDYRTAIICMATNTFNTLPLIDNQIVINNRNYLHVRTAWAKIGQVWMLLFRMVVPVFSQKSGREISPLKEG